MRYRRFISVFQFFLTSLFRNLRVRCERECARLSLFNGKRTPSIMFLYFLFHKLFNVELHSNNNFKQPFSCSLFFLRLLFSVARSANGPFGYSLFVFSFIASHEQRAKNKSVPFAAHYTPPFILKSENIVN